MSTFLISHCEHIVKDLISLAAFELPSALNYSLRFNFNLMVELLTQYTTEYIPCISTTTTILHYKL